MKAYLKFSKHFPSGENTSIMNPLQWNIPQSRTSWTVASSSWILSEFIWIESIIELSTDTSRDCSTSSARR